MKSYYYTCLFVDAKIDKQKKKKYKENRMEVIITNKETKQLVMKDDIMFKAFFSRIGNEKYLKSFLMAILGKEIEIKEVIHDSRLEQLAREQKYGILDLDVKLENGEIINIEMQMQDHKNMEKRTTFYASKKITEQVGTGTRYDDIKKVIVISILNYTFLEVPEYVNKTIRVLDKHREYEINNIVEYYYIELEKFRKTNPNMKEAINQWLSFIDMERGDLLEMAEKESEEIKEAKKVYNELSGEAEMKRLAEIRLISEMEEQAALSSARAKGTEEGMKKGLEDGIKKGLEDGMKKGLEDGMKKGLEDGMKKGLEDGMKKGLEDGMKKGLEDGIKKGLENGKIEERKKIAKKLLKSGMLIEQVSNITGLSETELLALKNK